MSYPSYPYDYMYPNEVVDGLVWLPIVATYMLFISLASGSAILVSLGVLFNVGVLRRLTPLLLMVSLASGLSFLLGPLADLRRPDRAIYIFIYPHVIPSEQYPGVSLIALMASFMWPLLVILLVATWYLALYKGLWDFFVTRIITLMLILVGLVLSTYPALLLFTALPILKIYNLIPLLPAEVLMESIALACSIALLTLIVHYRIAEASISRLLGLGVIVAGVIFVLLRFLEMFRLHAYLAGAPHIQIFLEVFTGLNIVTLILALISILLAVHVYFKGLKISSILLALVVLLWVFVDRWLLVVNIQSISKTLIAIIPVSLDLVSWALESIAMILLAMFIYYVLYTWVIKTPLLTLKGEGGRGGVG